MTITVSNLKAWVVLLVGIVSAAMVAVMSVTLDAGTAEAATPTKATIEATQFQIASGEIGEGFARCPGTKRAVGGGVVVPDGPRGQLRVLASGPLDATGITLETNDGDVAKQWYTAVWNLSGTQQTVKVFALCSGTSNATIEATQVSAGPRQLVAEGYATCPGTKRALGGGVVQSGSPADVQVRASGPLDATGFTLETKDGDIAKHWYAAVANFGFDSGGRVFRVFAICSGASTATIEATQFQLSANVGGARLAKCSGTKRALGGGVVQSGSAEDLFLRASGPLDGTGVLSNTNDGDIAKQWYGNIWNSSTAPKTFKVFAVCE